LVAYGVFPIWNWTIVSFVDKERLFKYSNTAMTITVSIAAKKVKTNYNVRPYGDRGTERVKKIVAVKKWGALLLFC
jgi:hypothetical protein